MTNLNLTDPVEIAYAVGLSLRDSPSRARLISILLHMLLLPHNAAGARVWRQMDAFVARRAVELEDCFDDDDVVTEGAGAVEGGVVDDASFASAFGIDGQAVDASADSNASVVAMGGQGTPGNRNDSFGSDFAIGGTDVMNVTREGFGLAGEDDDGDDAYSPLAGFAIDFERIREAIDRVRSWGEAGGPDGDGGGENTFVLESMSSMLFQVGSGFFFFFPFRVSVRPWLPARTPTVALNHHFASAFTTHRPFPPPFSSLRHRRKTGAKSISSSMR